MISATIGPRCWRSCAVAAVLAEHFSTIEQLQNASVEQLSQIQEIGEIIAETVHGFLNCDYGKKTIAGLVEAGVVMRSEQVSRSLGGELAGKTLVVSGTLEKYTRDEIHAIIERQGGKAASSISKRTDYLVAGEKAGSKLAKAEKLGVKVITEKEFDALSGTD